MICLNTQHFYLNRILLLAVGIWPYQRSKLAQLQFVLLYSILITFIAFQLTTFLTSKFTIDFVIKILSYTFFFIFLAITYNSFWINADIVKYSLDRLQHFCNELKNENEIAIIKKYGVLTKYYTAAIMMLGVCSIVINCFMSLWPCILDVILPLNNSRPHRTQIVTEYFVDQENYFYLILLHTNAAVCIGVVALIATGTMLIGYMKHTCGMLSIAREAIRLQQNTLFSFRIEQAMMTNTLRNVNQNNEILIYKGIIYAVDIHRKATEFSKFIISNFEGSFFCLLMTIMISLSANLVRTALSINNIEELLMRFLITLGLYAYVLVSNHIAQEITDHNNYVFATVYNVQWYIAPIRIQKMILFLLQRGTKAFNLNLGGLFVGSLENAAMLVSTSISYFTVLYSTRSN